MSYTAFVLNTASLLVIFVASTSSQCLSKNDSDMGINKKSQKDLLQSQLEFSVDILRELGNVDPTENIFFSPSSIYNALILAYFASANQTEYSLKDTLHIPEMQDKSATFGAYSLEKYKMKMRSIKGSTNYQLSNANRIFISDKVKVRPCMMKLFNDEIKEVDFTKNVSATVNKINKWVAEQTRNKITDLLSPESINDNTNVVLTNAAYFKGFWVKKFSPEDTKKSDFILANGTTVPVMMMNQENQFIHWAEENIGAEVLELPYEGDDISMFILLPLKPSEMTVADMLNKTDSKTLVKIIAKSKEEPMEVSVAIPKFSVDQTLELTPVLESLGVGDLFQSSANLSTLTGQAELKVDAAIHKAKIAVDEAGTEAAAATAIFANRFAADTFKANHPFVYLIVDKKSNILLFAGIFNSPET